LCGRIDLIFFAVASSKYSVSSVVTFAVNAGSPKVVRCPYANLFACMSRCVVSFVSIGDAYGAKIFKAERTTVLDAGAPVEKMRDVPYVMFRGVRIIAA
jgi:hypothetical protein